MPYFFTKTNRTVVFNGESDFYVQGNTYADAQVEKLPAHYVTQAFDYVPAEVLQALKKVSKV